VHRADDFERGGGEIELAEAADHLSGAVEKISLGRWMPAKPIVVLQLVLGTKVLSARDLFGVYRANRPITGFVGAAQLPIAERGRLSPTLAKLRP